MKVEVATGEVDVKLFVVVGNSQVHIEDGVATSCESYKVSWISRVDSHGLNCEGHRLIYRDISLHSRSDF